VVVLWLTLAGTTFVDFFLFASAVALEDCAAAGLAGGAFGWGVTAEGGVGVCCLGAEYAPVAAS
jgi:hypothetical protein